MISTRPPQSLSDTLFAPFPKGRVGKGVKIFQLQAVSGGGGGGGDGGGGGGGLFVAAAAAAAAAAAGQQHQFGKVGSVNAKDLFGAGGNGGGNSAEQVTTTKSSAADFDRKRFVRGKMGTGTDLEFCRRKHFTETLELIF